MTLTTSTPKIRETRPINQVTQLQELALKIQNEALAQAYAKMVPVQQALGLEYLLKNRDFFQSFKYYLAEGVAKTVGANDRQLQAVYLFEPSTNPDAETGECLPLEATIHLLIVVSNPSAALDIFVEALDNGLTRHLNQMPSPLLAKCSSILNAIVLSKEAVDQRQGYASLVSSILAPPFKLWERAV